MKTFFKLFVLPVAVGLSIAWAILGTYRGTSVRDDYAWILGAIVAACSFHAQMRHVVLQDEIERLRERLDEMTDRTS